MLNLVILTEEDVDKVGEVGLEQQGEEVTARNVSQVRLLFDQSLDLTYQASLVFLQEFILSYLGRSSQFLLDELVHHVSDQSRAAMQVG
jgi:hypothetical protein